jgi:PDDEXK-like uncharacterized protein DUF3799
MITVTAPGIYTMPAADYHADPCPAPSLSASVARELLSQSAEHARWAHPRLNAAYEPDVDSKFDVGTAAHAALLEGDDSNVVLVEADNWATKAAKAARDMARADGKTPILSRQWAEVVEMVKAARRQLATHEDKPTPLTGAGKPEQTVVWQEADGAWCRARLDWLFNDHRIIDDYKTTPGTANPEVWCRRMLWSLGYDVQAAFYRRGVKAVTGIDPTFRFIPQETYAPHALAVVALAPQAMELADRKVEHAISAWRECLRTGAFPGYPRRTVWAELPSWEEAQWVEREARDSWARGGVEDDGGPVGALLNRE